VFVMATVASPYSDDVCHRCCFMGHSYGDDRPDPALAIYTRKIGGMKSLVSATHEFDEHVNGIVSLRMTNEVNGIRSVPRPTAWKSSIQHRPLAVAIPIVSISGRMYWAIVDRYWSRWKGSRSVKYSVSSVRVLVQIFLCAGHRRHTQN
jgi:hypothetical protein